MESFLFQDVLDSKNSAIKDLQYELARVCKVYSFFLLSWELYLCFHYISATRVDSWVAYYGVGAQEVDILL